MNLSDYPSGVQLRHIELAESTAQTIAQMPRVPRGTPCAMDMREAYVTDYDLSRLTRSQIDALAAMTILVHAMEYCGVKDLFSSTQPITASQWFLWQIFDQCQRDVAGEKGQQ